MKKYTSAILFLVIAFAIIIGITFKSAGSSFSALRTHYSVATTSPSVLSRSYTSAEVAFHSTETSCWTSIDGNVYDVTTWISKHPGGSQAILSLCGKDGSAAFDNQHGGQRRPAEELATFQIGTLSK